MLREYRIPAVAARSAASLDEALRAVAGLGYPVALKTDAPDVPHKSDVGGVRLGVASPVGLAAAGLRFSEILGGIRGQPRCNIDAIVSAIVCFSALVADLCEHLAGLDLNPLICSPAGVLAVDALAVSR